MSRISYIKTRELNKNSLYVIPNYNNYPKSKSLRTNELSLFQLNSSADYVYNFNTDRITMTKNGKILKIEGELIVNEIKFG